MVLLPLIPVGPCRPYQIDVKTQAGTSRGWMFFSRRMHAQARQEKELGPLWMARLRSGSETPVRSVFNEPTAGPSSFAVAGQAVKPQLIHGWKNTPVLNEDQVKKVSAEVTASQKLLNAATRNQ